MGRRFVVIVMDGVGVGALPDADQYGDQGSNTLGNLGRVLPLALPNFASLGLGNIVPLQGLLPAKEPGALVGRLAPRSCGKDTTVGHWELMGLITEQPFPTYPQGFPAEIVEAFASAVGRDVLGNKAASGTAIIEELGEEHLNTGKPIVYTSADSVFQVAAHVNVVPLEQLYEWCRVARSLLVGPHAVARVIARPFSGNPGAFVRTTDRKDFSLAPPGPTYLDHLQAAGVPVVALGKISEIFAGKGVTRSIKVDSNSENLALVQALVEGTASGDKFEEGLLFTNLVDFDMSWGHRNDAEGFRAGLQEVDRALPRLLEALRHEDQLLITADHGVDPTTPSTDHSREYVPLLLLPCPKEAPAAVHEGELADVGATIFNYLAGQRPRLAGRVIDELQPSRGWRPFPPTLATPGGEVVPVRVGPSEAEEAAAWLRGRWGKAPEWALVLGSGLADGLGLLQSPADRADFAEIPGWQRGAVPGQAYELFLIEAEKGRRLVVQAGRLHYYEGFDDGEVQLPTRTLAAWGVRHLLVTSASGGVDPQCRPGELVVISHVVDFSHLSSDGSPPSLPATSAPLAQTLGRLGLRVGVHACVPGPHYETRAELEVLRHLGMTTVSMSLAGEAWAARDAGMDLAAVAVVVNVGDTTHEQVLEGAATALTGLDRLLETILGPSHPLSL